VCGYPRIFGPYDALSVSATVRVFRSCFVFGRIQAARPCCAAVVFRSVKGALIMTFRLPGRLHRILGAYATWFSEGLLFLSYAVLGIIPRLQIEESMVLGLMGGWNGLPSKAVRPRFGGVGGNLSEVTPRSMERRAQGPEPSWRGR